VITAEDRAFLRAVTQRTWQYFETHVNPADHWLPPDNYQVEPKPDLAHRTSPTNIAMGLLSALATTCLPDNGQLLERVSSTWTPSKGLSATKATSELVRHATLAPLTPRYVSTVDSGNLAVSPSCFSTALRDLARGEGGAAAGRGLADTAGLLVGVFSPLAWSPEGAPLKPLLATTASVRDRLSTASDDDAPAHLAETLPELESNLKLLTTPGPNQPTRKKAAE
jgi:cyclic beta-1,2-glucan synthetase